MKKKIKGKVVQIWCFMRLFGVRAAYDRTRIDFVEEEIILKGTKETDVSSLPFIAKQAFNTNYPNITKKLLPSLQVIILFCTELVAAFFLDLKSLLALLLFTNAFQQFFYSVNSVLQLNTMNTFKLFI